ncbi:iron-containing alcohol dehydrogenase [Alkalibacterium thalassium]|uniref:Alcohol dehydrogenase, class IV n=1 Tax=Alkalibacterium thalassium TaxID=426701 RepID=A0A1G9FHF5_9LACT|nr:iron-containing alcohol dehydrogenase [Alkalibacterium thalassium]SDK87838.1 Alcohol dehydrogenase, class IV [Alkalibacterium thalassium]
MITLLNRLYQKSLHLTSFFLSWKDPELLKGPGSVHSLPDIIRSHSCQRVLILTDSGITRAGVLNKLKTCLDQSDISYTIFSDIEANPSIRTIERAAVRYNSFHSDCIVAVGGGSVLDASKAASIIIGKPQKSLKSFKGLLKIRHALPPLIAVPTTAGTGSEATAAAVVSDPEKKEKFTIMDPSLIPDYAVLDPVLLKSLPPQLTAETGMDALTHAVEAYIGRSNTSATRRLSEEAILLIHSNLLQSYNNGSDLTARENMLMASYKAGQAFTRAYVGNIHAISHALTAFYGAPHGRTNAMLLPVVLRYYGSAVQPDLSRLSDKLGLTESSASEKEKAEAFISWIEKLNQKMTIPDKLDRVQKKDYLPLSRHAIKEANPLYPVPVMFTSDDFTAILDLISN